MARDQPHHAPATTPPTHHRNTPHTTHHHRQRTPARSGGDRPPPPAAKPSQEWRGVAHRNLRQEWRGTPPTHQPHTATKPPAKNTEGGQTPHPEGTEDRTSKQAQADHPAKTGNTKPGTAAHREKGHRNKQTPAKKKKPAAQPKRKETGGETTRHGTGIPRNRKKKMKKKKKAQKTHPDNPAQKGGAQPRPGPSTHAHTAHRNRKRRGARETRTKPHTSRKRADTKAQPRTPQTAGKRGTTPQTEPKHTHPRPQPRRAGVNKTHDQPQPGPNHQRKPTVGNPVPTARALRQPAPCR